MICILKANAAAVQFVEDILKQHGIQLESKRVGPFSACPKKIIAAVFFPILFIVAISEVKDLNDLDGDGGRRGKGLVLLAQHA